MLPKYDLIGILTYYFFKKLNFQFISLITEILCTQNLRGYLLLKLSSDCEEKNSAT